MSDVLKRRKLIRAPPPGAANTMPRKVPANKLRLSEDPLEQYARVDKMLGNGMFYARTPDHTLVAHIRAKHRGRNKHANVVRPGALVLVGLREWENPRKNADLICTYDDAQEERIRPLEPRLFEEDTLIDAPELAPEAPLCVDDI